MLKFEPINLNNRILVTNSKGNCLGDISKLGELGWLFCSTGPEGQFWDKDTLRLIADKLDELNAPWDEEVRRGLEAANCDRGERPAADRLPWRGDF